VASLDLGSAFEVMNVDLLVKPLKITGIPDNIVQLIKVLLKSSVILGECG
jgi:hypothetical protein